MLNKIRFHLTYTQILLLGFLVVILTGTLLLCLPISSRTGEWTPLLPSAFTATSAACVTGLITVDTYTHWSVFGQVVILLLIQTGGLGLMTILTMLSVVLKRKVSLHEQRLAMLSAGGTEHGTILLLIKHIFILTFGFEFLGAVVLATQFIPLFGIGRGAYYAVFHSVSAFCNAGFDLMGTYAPFSSLTPFCTNAVVSVTIALLIVVGGVGFLVWSDILHHGWHVRKYDLHSKMVLTMTTALILIGWVLFYIFERHASMAGLTEPQKILASFFQSVTPRTAGFNTVDQAALSEAGNLLTTVLMFIGASPGSTGGGIKTTTVFVLLLSILAAAKKDNHITVFKRRLDAGIVRQTNIIISIYLFGTIAATLAICGLEPGLALKEVLYEVVSAIATVGLTTGITPSLGGISKAILILLMYMGRVGGLSVALALVRKKAYVPIERPTQKILIG